MPGNAPHAASDLLTDRLVDALTSAGWQPLPSDEEDVVPFVRHESTEVDYEMGVNLGIRDYIVSTSPSLGVVHPETSRLRSQFYGRTPSSGSRTAMFGSNLEELLPDFDGLAPYRRWGVRSAEDVPRVTQTLAADLATYGLPFLRSIPTLDAAISRLEGVKRHFAQEEHLAIAYALTGRISDALPILHEYVVQARTQQSPLSIQSWRFIRAFIEHFGIPESALPYELGA